MVAYYDIGVVHENHQSADEQMVLEEYGSDHLLSYTWLVHWNNLRVVLVLDDYLLSHTQLVRLNDLRLVVAVDSYQCVTVVVAIVVLMSIANWHSYLQVQLLLWVYSSYMENIILVK